MSDELKACPLCPFCGGNNAEHVWGGEFGDEYWVCDQCGASSGNVDSKRNWNTRPLEDALRLERDAAMKAQREAERMVERLIEASKVVIANAYENEGWVLLNSIVKIQTLIDEWCNRKETK